jgi:hypothetical protein
MLIFCATILLLAVVVAWTLVVVTRDRLRWRMPLELTTDRVGQPTTIHTRDGKVINGLLLDELPDRTRLSEAKYVEGGTATPVPGGVAMVPRANESWRQEHQE